MMKNEMFCFKCGKDVSFKPEPIIGGATLTASSTLTCGCQPSERQMEAPEEACLWVSNISIGDSTTPVYRMLIARNVIVVDDKRIAFMDRKTFIKAYEDDNTP